MHTTYYTRSIIKIDILRWDVGGNLSSISCGLWHEYASHPPLRSKGELTPDYILTFFCGITGRKMGKTSRTDFEWVYTQQPHVSRRKIILGELNEVMLTMFRAKQRGWLQWGLAARDLFVVECMFRFVACTPRCARQKHLAARVRLVHKPYILKFKPIKTLVQLPVQSAL